MCRLHKSLYELKQAPAIWNATLHAMLTKLAFIRLDADYGLYKRHAARDDNTIAMLLTVYVDDLLLIGPPPLCQSVAKRVMASLELVSLGPVKFLLEIEIVINPTRQQVTSLQRRYVDEFLQRFHMATCNGCRTPEATNKGSAKSRQHAWQVSHRRIPSWSAHPSTSGSRPDIVHAVMNLSEFLATTDHYGKWKLGLRYFKFISVYGLVMRVKDGNEVDLRVHTDADYVNADHYTRVSGYLTILDGNTMTSPVGSSR